MKQYLQADITGERLDAFLARQLPDKSRAYWQKIIGQGRVTSGDNVLKASSRLVDTQPVVLLLPIQPDFSDQALPVLYEDDDVLVINKPAGMLTHTKDTFNHEFTVAEFVRPRTTDGHNTDRPGIVHRLDRGTSGVIITAKHAQAKQWLQTQFAERKVKKMYLALVTGHLTEPSAILRLPIERNPHKPQTFRVGGNGKPAETAYETDHAYSDSTLLRLFPLTGRTHQLRVHLSYLGHPILGDELYGKPAPRVGRMFLHAASLEITLPTGTHKIFSAPLPEALRKYLSLLIPYNAA